VEARKTALPAQTAEERTTAGDHLSDLGAHDRGECLGGHCGEPADVSGLLWRRFDAADTGVVPTAATRQCGDGDCHTAQCSRSNFSMESLAACRTAVHHQDQILLGGTCLRCYVLVRDPVELDWNCKSNLKANDRVEE